MWLVEIVEGGDRRIRARNIVLVAVSALLAAAFLLGLARCSRVLLWGWQDSYVDFDAYRIAAEMFKAGLGASAYHLRDLVAFRHAFFPDLHPLSWAYPPQFVLVVEALEPLPLGVAYALFMLTSLAAYASAIGRLAPGRFGTLAILLAPSFAMLLRCGQNGFLSGALMGWAALGLVEGRASAGAALGLMAIKPHLAVSMALNALLSQRWKFVAVAAAAVAATSAAATLAYGAQIWPAFSRGVHEAGVFLAVGYFPSYRMISFYAFLQSLGLSSSLCAALQSFAAIAAVVACHAALRRFTARLAVAIAAVAAVTISPYAYDYDLPVFGVGLALLIGDLERYGTSFERVTLYATLIAVQFIGLADALLVDTFSTGVKPVSVGFLSASVTMVVVWRVLERARAPQNVAAPLQSCPA